MPQVDEQPLCSLKQSSLGGRVPGVFCENKEAGDDHPDLQGHEDRHLNTPAHEFAVKVVEGKLDVHEFGSMLSEMAAARIGPADDDTNIRSHLL